PQRSVLHPPKQAPSVWQIFFIDWLQKQKSSEGEGKKLNVAQEAKEAGHVYNELSQEERDALKQRALHFKENYEREFTAWKRTLTPTDIERENAFRAAQRKAGKSRRKNINDPNAPKRPLTAYFLFLQAIRADPQMTRDVFGDTTESTRQSVLAAAKWRSMSDVEKQRYLTEADNAKREYDAIRREYDERLRSLNELSATSVLVYPASSPESSTTACEIGVGMPDTALHK
ncbi:high mobility group box domain-containing protein, partial [Gautieria morchelliformis]